MQIQVDKYHGCGNDFILLDWDSAKEWSDEVRTDFIVQVCDRHTGIGADGCIFVKKDPLEMIYYNQDGSRADMCGNGIRCFANYCYDHQITNTPDYIVKTLAGDQIIHELSHDPFMVQITMGKPDFSAGKIQLNSKVLVQISKNRPDPSCFLSKQIQQNPAGSMQNHPDDFDSDEIPGNEDPAGVILPESFQVPKALWHLDLPLQDQIYRLHSMYMGTIHTVVFVEDAFAAELEQIGKAICEHPLFEKQTNVNFIQVLDPTHIKASTYERGCGMTLACGTGMCASGVACLQEGLADSHLDVLMKKGQVHIDIDQNGTVYLTGPARHIMKGTFDYEYLPSQKAA